MTSTLNKSFGRMASRPKGMARPRVSDATKARAAAAALWALVIVGAAGGAVSLLGPSPDSGHSAEPTPEASDSLGGVAVAGWGERFLAAYLAADARDPDSEAALAGFLGYAPELPPGQAPAEGAGLVRAVEAEEVAGGEWAVTVAAGEPGQEAFWRLRVTRRSGRLVATGLPTPVAAPTPSDEPELLVSLSGAPPADDPVVETMSGWVAAYACGQGDAGRYLAPAVELRPVTPAVCDEARLDRWGAQEDGDGRLYVVTEATLASGGEDSRRVSFAVRLARRAGRWEVAELLAGPPLARDVDAEAGL